MENFNEYHLGDGKMAKKCYVITNTKIGYCCQPHYCNSISEAVRYAKNLEMAYRVFDMNGNLIKRG